MFHAGISPGHCTPTEFRCGHKCLPLGLRCNGIENCLDGADEKECTEIIRNSWRHNPREYEGGEDDRRNGMGESGHRGGDRGDYHDTRYRQGGSDEHNNRKGHRGRPNSTDVAIIHENIGKGWCLVVVSFIDLSHVHYFEDIYCLMIIKTIKL